MTTVSGFWFLVSGRLRAPLVRNLRIFWSERRAVRWIGGHWEQWKSLGAHWLIMGRSICEDWPEREDQKPESRNQKLIT
jgi:hypothetical protein